MYRRYKVTLFFGGDECPQLPPKDFLVSASDPSKAINVALYDAINTGYKRAWVVSHIVEIL